jgi:glycosyltransferase involved in cell wall biosynthesis
MLEEVFKRADEFDIIHFHVDYLHFPMSRRLLQPTVTTLHGRLDLPDLVPLYREFLEMPVVSISTSQREPLPWLNWQATVYHGLPEELYRLHAEPGKYLAFLGRISPEKGVDQAIAIAQKVGVELRIAAKVDRVDEEYFEQTVRPLLNHPLIHFVGEVHDAEKDAFLGNALALLVPVNWEEPFGLVMIEAMACGTPVVAYRRGSIPEVIDEGATGHIVQTVDQAAKAIGRISRLSRKRCRQLFEERFTASRMASDYVAVYERLIEEGTEDKTLSPGRPFWTTTSSA